MQALIHPTALIEDGAQLEADVRVGPYSVIGAHVSLGSGTVVGPHCVIDGHTRIGRNNQFYRFCSIGGMPQDKKYKGEPTRLEIGDGNMVREYVTINTGTAQDGGVTCVGDDNWIMAYVHIAHDCQIASHTILANNVQLAGHIHVGDSVVIGGSCAVHQFVRIGAHAMIGGVSAIRQDIPPYTLGAGNPFRLVGLNTEGLTRRGFSPATIAVLKEVYRLLYRRKLTLPQAIAQIQALQQTQTQTQAQQPPMQTQADTQDGNQTRAAVQVMLDFLQTASRGMARG